MHDHEVQEKSKKASKMLEEILATRKISLQPKLDLILNEKRVVCEKNEHLEETMKAMRTKQLTAVDLMVKLKKSFEYFVMDTKQLPIVEARKIVDVSISCHKTENEELK